MNLSSNNPRWTLQVINYPNRTGWSSKF